MLKVLNTHFQGHSNLVSKTTFVPTTPFKLPTKTSSQKQFVKEKCPYFVWGERLQRLYLITDPTEVTLSPLFS